MINRPPLPRQIRQLHGPREMAAGDNYICSLSVGGHKLAAPRLHWQWAIGSLVGKSSQQSFVAMWMYGSRLPTFPQMPNRDKRHPRPSFSITVKTWISGPCSRWSKISSSGKGEKNTAKTCPARQKKERKKDIMPNPTKTKRGNFNAQAQGQYVRVLMVPYFCNSWSGCRNFLLFLLTPQYAFRYVFITKKL